MNKTIELGVLLCFLLLSVVPTLLESCITLWVFIILVSFSTLTGGDGCERATADEVRIILLAVFVVFGFHHLKVLQRKVALALHQNQFLL